MALDQHAGLPRLRLRPGLRLRQHLERQGPRVQGACRPQDSTSALHHLITSPVRSTGPREFSDDREPALSLHTDLAIYQTADKLFDLVLDLQKHFPRELRLVL